MKRRPSGLTLIELLVVIVVGAAVMVFVLLWRTQANEKQNMINCAKNLRQIGQAMQLYAQDNLRLGGIYPRLHYKAEAPNTLDASGADLAWSGAGNNPFSDAARDGTGAGAGQSGIGYNNVPAAAFLLLRTQAISADAFVCPAASQRADDYRRGGTQREKMQCGNFGDIRRNLSYGFSNPYPTKEALQSGFRMSTAMNPEFALVADIGPGTAGGQNPYGMAGAGGLAATPKSPIAQLRAMNSNNHRKVGQNVLFADGHVEFVPNVFAGIKGNNIYVPDKSDDNGATIYIGTTDLKGTNAKSSHAYDSVLLPWQSDN